MHSSNKYIHVEKTHKQIRGIGDNETIYKYFEKKCNIREAGYTNESIKERKEENKWWIDNCRDGGIAQCHEQLSAGGTGHYTQAARGPSESPLTQASFYNLKSNLKKSILSTILFILVKFLLMDGEKS